MRAAVEQIERAEGAVGVLVNNAGYSLSGAVESVPLEDARRQFETNVFGLARLTQLVLPGMRRQGCGRVVNVSSMGGRLTFPGGGWYHASKHAVEALSDALRFEVQGFGIDVVVIEPGLDPDETSPRRPSARSGRTTGRTPGSTRPSARRPPAPTTASRPQARRRSRHSRQGDRTGAVGEAAAHALPRDGVGEAHPDAAAPPARPQPGTPRSAAPTRSRRCRGSAPRAIRTSSAAGSPTTFR